MRSTSLALVALFAMTLVTTSACGADTPKTDVRARIAGQLDVKPEDIRPSPVPGLFEVVSGSEVGYVSEDGRFYIDGDVFDMETRRNLTEQRRAGSRVALLKGIKDSDTIVFAPKEYQYTLNVFTDVDCTYCRKLHAEIDQYTGLGIKVRYLMYPRSGPGSPAWKQAQAVWCSNDRGDALTRAKRGEHVESRACKDSVAQQYELGQELGVRGTPGIYTEQGEYIAGYMPAPRLLQYLKSLSDKG